MASEAEFRCHDFDCVTTSIRLRFRLVFGTTFTDSSGGSDWSIAVDPIKILHQSKKDQDGLLIA
jgi:hypothetical protein